MKKIILIASILLLASCGVNDQIVTTNNVEDTNTMINKEVTLENGDIVAVMKTTMWDITILLETELVPITTNNFIGLSKKDYYDEVTFHRVMNWFMIQAWDPTWTWKWGESIYWNTFDDEFSNELSNLSYTVSMANRWDDTNSSQFFINIKDNTNLDFDKQPLTSKHVVFGQIIKWFDVVDAIWKVEVSIENGNKPLVDIVINDIDIKEYQNEEYIDYSFDEQEVLKTYEENIALELEAKKDKVLVAGDVVFINYVLTLSDWTVKESSYTSDQLISFTLGQWQVIPWWENWLLGHKIWDKFSLEVSPEDGYWLLEMPVEKSLLQEYIDNGYKLEKWEFIPTYGWEIEILEVDETTVTLKNPSELAWETLFFDMEVMNIK